MSEIKLQRDESKAIIPGTILWDTNREQRVYFQAWSFDEDGNLALCLVEKDGLKWISILYLDSEIPEGK